MSASPSSSIDGLHIGANGVPTSGRREKIFNWIVDKNTGLFFISEIAIPSFFAVNVDY